MDDVDRAQEANEAHLADALAERERRARMHSRISATHCADCEEPIPLARRVAVSGCTRCVECQTLHENWRPV